jgi:hypothetical protein
MAEFYLADELVRTGKLLGSTWQMVRSHLTDGVVRSRDGQMQPGRLQGPTGQKAKSYMAESQDLPGRCPTNHIARPYLADGYLLLAA